MDALMTLLFLIVLLAIAGFAFSFCDFFIRAWAIVGAVCVFVASCCVGYYVDRGYMFFNIGFWSMLLFLYFANRYKEQKPPRVNESQRAMIAARLATLRRKDTLRQNRIEEDSVRQEAEAAERPDKVLTRVEAIESELPEILTDKEIDEYIDRLVRGEEEIEDGRDRIKTEIREAQPDLADEEIETILALTIDAPARALGMTPDVFVNSLHYHKENRP